MFSYFRSMRTRDEQKVENIYNAAITLVNRDGFESASMSKIAKAANVSPATIYIYFDNKKDLLVKTYLKVKKEIASNVLTGIDVNQSVEKAFRSIWFNYYNSITAKTDYFNFAEQFANSPIINSVNNKEIDAYYELLISLFARGQQEGIIKNVHREILFTYGFFPMFTLLKMSKIKKFDLSVKNIDDAFQAAWDAIRA